jgi:hypothetical protein
MTAGGMIILSIGLKYKVMKGSRNSNNKQSKQGHVNTPRPEIRDNMDSRKEKEVNYRDKNNKSGRKPNTKDKNEAGH